MPRRINVAILGAGIGAAFAIRACKDFGDQVAYALYARAYAPPPKPSFWIHCERGIPLSWHIKPELILVDSLGTKRRYYSQLLWSREDIPTSFPSETHWTMGANAEHFWVIQVNPIDLIESDFHSMAEIAILAQNYDLVFKTFRFKIKSQQLRPVFVTKKFKPLPKQNQVIYNGQGHDLWLRKSQLFGNQWEYTEWAEQPQEDFTTIYKIWPGSISAPEDLPNNVVNLGRWGKWERKHLAHENYWAVLDALKTWSIFGTLK